MSSLTVTIKPKHMVGNSWSHGSADADRKCPLDEALRDSGFENVEVGGISFAINGKRYLTYEHPVWNMDNAEKLIKEANEGDLKEITLTFDE